MTRKSEEQIDAEIAKLEALLPKLPKHTRGKVGASLEVLRERMGNDEVYDRWGEDESADEEFFDDELWAEVMGTYLWMSGEGTGVAPSEGWASLAG